jgi:hypothetical protein
MALAAVDRLGVYQVFVSLNHPNSAAIYGLKGRRGGKENRSRAADSHSR